MARAWLRAAVVVGLAIMVGALGLERAHEAGAQSPAATKLTMVARSGSALEQQTALAIAPKLKEIGLNVEVVNLDYTTMAARARRAALSGETWAQGGFDIIFFNLAGMAFEPAGMNRYFHSASKTAANFWSLADPQLDRELDAGSTTLDTAKRAEAYARAAKVLRDDMPVVPIFHPRLVYALRAGWTGIKANQVNQSKATASFFQMKYQGRDAKHLRMATPEDIRTPNALFDWTNPGKTLNSMVFDSLVMLDDNLQPLLPALAQSWTFTDGGKTATFKLRKGVKWHDGKPFTSRDVKFSFETRMNKEAGAELSSGFRMVEQVQAPDESTIVLKLREPYAPLLFEVGLTEIVPAHVFDGVAPKELSKSPYTSGEKLIPGTGPYRLVTWKKREQIELEANPDYFRGKPTVSRITLSIIPDKSTALASIRGGEVDVLDVMYELTKELDELKADPAITLFVYEALNVEVMGFNLKHPALSHPAVRQAIAMAVPKEHIAKDLGRGYLTVANQLLHPQSWGYAKSLPPVPFDVNAARELLKKQTP
jgi:ABC-type transport system substrate-binding protein